ncbi:MAG: L-2-hydroxyglutarate oxidase [Deltaproteobacteria bacterium]|nr:L-2-hydroxyglutarate oxidase [Deltaproteobacteria bacterium]
MPDFDGRPAPPSHDLIVVGGGIVGLACAHAALVAHPDWRVLVLEKEAELAAHQTGRNSGVIHSGIYYTPGSAKARLCRAGREQLIDFCTAEGVPFELCGKVIVAACPEELPALDLLLARGEENGVDCELVEAAGLHALEPHAGGLAALHVRDAGIVDFGQVARKLAEKIEAAGGEIRRSCAVTCLIAASPEAAAVYLDDGSLLRASRAIACAGLHSDRLAEKSGLSSPVRIVPFRGEYHELKPTAAAWVKGLIYPVPDPRYPFLGVHLTRHIDGRVSCGPNAVLAWAREGYRRGAFSLRDATESLRSRGLRRLMRQNLRTGLAELRRSYSRRRFAADAARLLPGLKASDLRPGRPGIRAQALLPDGRLADDFVILSDGPVTHVLNAPSPAATASLAIGAHIAGML